MEAILGGANIVDKAGNVVDKSNFLGTGKKIGIYFSAHWCPPCRGFTPQLADFYNKVKASAAGANFEIIFVSCDRDAASFQSYFGEMPWLALSYDQTDINQSLSQRFGVRGIPMLVILDGETGAVKDADGRATVGKHLDGSMPANW